MYIYIFRFLSSCYCMLPADTWHIFEAIQQCTLRGCSHIYRVRPPWEEKNIFLLSLHVSEGEYQKILDHAFHSVVVQEKPGSWYLPVSPLFSQALSLLRKTCAGSLTTWWCFPLSMRQDTTLHQQRNSQSQFFPAEGSSLSSHSPRGRVRAGRRPGTGAKRVIVMHRCRLWDLFSQGQLPCFVRAEIPGCRKPNSLLE